MKKSRQLVWFLAFSLLMVFTAAQAGDWEKLVTRTVKHSVDKDVIQVGKNQGIFTAVKFTVHKAGIHLLDMKIHFANDEVMDVQIRSFIENGGESRVIDLPGNNRKIDKIVFWYKTFPKREKAARVSLWGRHP